MSVREVEQGKQMRLVPVPANSSPNALIPYARKAPATWSNPDTFQVPGSTSLVKSGRRAQAGSVAIAE